MGPMRGYEKGGMVKYGKGIHAVAPYYSPGRQTFVRPYLRNKSNAGAQSMSRTVMIQKMQRFANEIRFYDDDAHRFARLQETRVITPPFSVEASGVHEGVLRKMQRFEKNLLRWSAEHPPIQQPAAAPQAAAPIQKRKRKAAASVQANVQAVEERREEGIAAANKRKAKAQAQSPPPSPPRAQARINKPEHYTQEEILEMIKRIHPDIIQDNLKDGTIMKWVSENPQEAQRVIEERLTRIRELQKTLRTWHTLSRKAAKKLVTQYNHLQKSTRSLQLAYALNTNGQSSSNR